VHPKVASERLGHSKIGITRKRLPAAAGMGTGGLSPRTRAGQGHRCGGTPPRAAGLILVRLKIGATLDFGDQARAFNLCLPLGSNE
jgi:hypothetical protein